MLAVVGLLPLPWAFCQIRGLQFFLKSMEVIKMRFKVFSFLLALSLVLAGQSHAGIVGHWTFEEGSGNVAADSSGNGNDGQFVGDGLTWGDGGLHFDGTSWLDCGPGASLDFSGSTNFSAVATVEAEEAGGKCIIWKGLGCSTWSQWLLGTGAHENGDNEPTAAFHIRASNGGDRLEARSADAIPTGEQIQVAGTYDGAKLKVYVNGALAGEADASATPWASGENVYIGADPGCNNRCQWVGTMYEITVYDETLSEDDISTAVSSAGKLATTWGEIKR